MSSIARFFSLGAQDADRRVAAALAPVTTEAADRYLKGSAIVIAIDRVTRRLDEMWRTSEAGRALSGVQAFAGKPFGVRYPAIGSLILTAVAAHVALTLFQGPRPGWFWMVVPGMAALFAALLLAGTRSSQSTD